MPKRSREASFSPSAGLTSSDSVSDDGADSDEAAHPGKISALSTPVSHQGHAMQCSLPPHRHTLDFPSIDAFEIHYAKDHSNRCTSCGKNFPSPHFLTLHIDENHNALREELQAKGERTYACLVEDCERKCSTPQKRRLHLIDKHAFPKVYNFRVIDKGIDHSSSMLQESKSHRRRVSTTNAPADTATRRRRASNQQVNGEMMQQPTQSRLAKVKNDPATARESHGTAEGQLDELTRSMSALKFVPPSVMRQQMSKPPK